MSIDPATPPLGNVRDWLDLRAQEGGTAFVFTEEGQKLDWSELHEEARRTAYLLTHRGAQKGESIAIVHPNSRAGIIALYGALYGGFRATMINLAAGPEAFSYALEHSESRFAFVHEDCADRFAAVTTGDIHTLDCDELSDPAPLFELTASDQALLMYTSGTTGQPKGVVHTHASLLAGGWTTTVAHALGPNDRGLCVLPIYHINGLCVSVMGALVSGGSLALSNKFSASKFWDEAAQSHVTWFSVVPTIISHLLHGSTDPDVDTKARLRFGRSASSALAPDVQTAFEARFQVPIVETMGLTETAAQILSNPFPPPVYAR